MTLLKLADSFTEIAFNVKSISPEAAEAAVASLERDKRYQQDVY